MKNNAIPVITIDGPSGSGKGTVSRAVARALGWHFLDSGALYRILALAAAEAGLDEPEAVAALAPGLAIRFAADEQGEEQIFLAEQDVTRQVRAEETGASASRLAAAPPVRAALVGLQHAFRQPPGLVADGRDMGTVIFPDARLKIFLTASAGERALRRHKQLNQKEKNASLAALSEEITARDQRDAERPISPLKPAPDAVVLDTTGIPAQAVIEQVLALSEKALTP